MKEFLKDFCRAKVHTCCIAAELAIAVWFTATGDYGSAFLAFVLSLMLIIMRLDDMRYESLRHYTDELEKRYFELLDGLIALCENKEKGPGE